MLWLCCGCGRVPGAEHCHGHVCDQGSSSAVLQCCRGNPSRMMDGGIPAAVSVGVLLISMTSPGGIFMSFCLRTKCIFSAQLILCTLCLPSVCGSLRALQPLMKSERWSHTELWGTLPQQKTGAVIRPGWRRALPRAEVTQPSPCPDHGTWCAHCLQQFCCVALALPLFPRLGCTRHVWQ